MKPGTEILEITVDLILLHHDKTNALGWKIHHWGISERMKAAEQVVDFYKAKGVPIPEEYEPLHKYYQNDKGLVDLTRLKLWPNKKNPAKPEHPRRWTGSSDLFGDVHKADLLYGSEIRDQLGVGLVEYYRTQYRQMNWQIHSGVAGFWNIPPEGSSFGCRLSDSPFVLQGKRKSGRQRTQRKSLRYPELFHQLLRGFLARSSKRFEISRFL
jgi:hypothetical protein